MFNFFKKSRKKDEDSSSNPTTDDSSSNPTTDDSSYNPPTNLIITPSWDKDTLTYDEKTRAVDGIKRKEAKFRLFAFIAGLAIIMVRFCCILVTFR